MSSVRTDMDSPTSRWQYMAVTAMKAKKVKVQLTANVDKASEVYSRIVGSDTRGVQDEVYRREEKGMSRILPSRDRTRER